MLSSEIVWITISHLPQVADYAKIPRWAMAQAYQQLTTDYGVVCVIEVAEQLKHCHRCQPGLAQWLRAQLNWMASSDAVTLAVFLCMLIWKAFQVFAGDRLGEIRSEQCDRIERIYRADEAVRAEKGWIQQETEDLVQHFQPEVVMMIREELEDINDMYDSINVLHKEMIYKMLLLQTLILSYAVKPEVSDQTYCIN